MGISAKPLLQIETVVTRCLLQGGG